MTALHWAAQMGRASVVQALLVAGAAIDELNVCVLHDVDADTSNDVYQ